MHNFTQNILCLRDIFQRGWIQFERLTAEKHFYLNGRKIWNKSQTDGVVDRRRRRR